MRRRNLGLIAVGLATAVGLSVVVGSAATATPARPAGGTGSAPGAAAPGAADAGAADAVGAAPGAVEADAAAAATKLFVRYRVKKNCTVYPNYPKAGVVGNTGRTWPITTTGTRSVIWRYNVNKTWALISDPTRAKKTFPWWGFTHRSCLGTSIKQKDYPAGRAVPSRILQGRSSRPSGWRKVDFSVSPAAKQRRVRLDSTATLRDPANFVIGNVFPTWSVDVTGRTRSNGHWVEVYVPNAKRWGYIEANNLR